MPRLRMLDLNGVTSKSVTDLAKGDKQRRLTMKITKTQLKQIIKEEMETALNNPRTDELKAALEVSYDTNLDPQEAAADILTVVEEFLSDKLGMPIELRY